MQLRVRYAGVPVGIIDLDALAGLAYASLAPVEGYALVRAQVESAGRALAPHGLAARRYWPPTLGDFADAIGAAVAGGYELQDQRGSPISAASVSVFAAPGHEAEPLVVVDFRPHAAHVFAAHPERDDSGEGRHRPAA